MNVEKKSQYNQWRRRKNTNCAAARKNQKKLIAKSNEVPSGDSSNALVCTIDM